MDYTPEVLRNKGVPVKLAKIRKAEDDWTPIYSSDGELETEELHVRFTHNIIADIEETWDGLADWQEAMESKPTQQYAMFTISKHGCQRLIQHQTHSDVEFKPGVGVRGKKVKRAELNKGS